MRTAPPSSEHEEDDGWEDNYEDWNDPTTHNTEIPAKERVLDEPYAPPRVQSQTRHIDARRAVSKSSCKGYGVVCAKGSGANR
jgi:hypothetical protein